MDGSDWNYTNWDPDTAEPHRLQGKFRRRHNCVYMGANTGDLGSWRDGPCKWIRSTVDCLCKKGDGKKRSVFIPRNREEEEEELIIETKTPDVIVRKEVEVDNNDQLVETPKKDCPRGW